MAKKAEHWRKELDVAEQKCRQENNTQAMGMYQDVMEEMRREAKKP
jgi:hypothetical protein